MSERRSHWDIDLVDGVGRRLIPLYRSIGYCTDAERHRIYTLIEFVEDWQDRTQQARAMSMTDNEATIQRVRELHYNTATHHPSGCCSECGGTYPCPTVRALDGGAE